MVEGNSFGWGLTNDLFVQDVSSSLFLGGFGKLGKGFVTYAKNNFPRIKALRAPGGERNGFTILVAQDMGQDLGLIIIHCLIT